MKFLLAIPCYNCEKQIQRVVESLATSDYCREKIDKVILFDNQSTDSTRKSALDAIFKHSLQNWISCFANYQNYGLGGTQKIALNYAYSNNYDYMIVLHGDDQASVVDLEKMLKQTDWSKKQNILGSRFMKKSKLRNYSLARIYGNQALNVAYSLAHGRRIYDLGSGLNIFSVSKSLIVNMNYFSDGFTFNMDMLLYFLKNKITIQFFPINWSESDQVSNARNFKVGWQALLTLANWKLNKTSLVSDSSSYGYVETCAIDENRK